MSRGILAACVTVAACGSEASVPMVTVWRTKAPEVTRERVDRIANAIGFTGVVVESDEGIQVVGRHVDPVGPIEARAIGGDARIGAGGRALSNSFAGGCADGEDNDGDAEVDLEDLECEGVEDDGEALPGHQPRSGAASILGRHDGGGSIVVERFLLPALSYLDGAGRTLEGRFDLTALGDATLDPATGEWEVRLPLQMIVSCVGAGCFAGSCTLDLGTVELSSAGPGAPYEQGDGHAVLAGTFPAPPAASCTGGASPSDVNSELGLPDPAASLRLEVALAPVLHERGAILSLARASGALFWDAPEHEKVGPAPDDATAEANARAFLATAGIDVADPQIHVERLADRSGVENVARVTFLPHLRVSADALVPVFDAGVEVDVGAAGRIVGVRSNWRAVNGSIETPLRAEAEARPDLPSYVTPSLPMQLAFFGRAHHAEQTYYDPSWIATAPDGTMVGTARATDFSPRVVALSPEPRSVVDGATPIPLRAEVQGGEPPYEIHWTSDIDGHLGTGAAIDVALSSGEHAIELGVTDARGAGGHVVLRFEVAGGSPKPAPRTPRGGPIVGSSFLAEPNGTSYVAVAPASGQLALSSMVLTKTRRGVAMQVLDSVGLDHWRYEIALRVNGLDYVLRSGRCIPGADASGGACQAPKTPCARVRTPIAPASRTPGSVTRSIVIDDLPGTLTLDLQYDVGDFDNLACNPPDFLYNLSGELLANSRLRQSAGEACPGVKPQVSWTYEPPATFTVEKLRDFCRSAPGRQESETRSFVADPKDISPPEAHEPLDLSGATAHYTRRGELFVTTRMFGAWPPPDGVHAWAVSVTLRDASGADVGKVTLQRVGGATTTSVVDLDPATVLVDDGYAVEGPVFLVRKIPGEAAIISVETSVRAGIKDPPTVDLLATPLPMPPLGTPYCDIPETVLDALTPSATLEITAFRALLYTKVVPFSHGVEATATLLQDDDGPTDAGNAVANTDGPLDDRFQPLGAWLATTDLFTHVRPMTTERSAIVAYDNGDPGDYDNYHAKATQASVGLPWAGYVPPDVPFPFDYVTFPGCNDVRDWIHPFGEPWTKSVGQFDLAPCVHVHERWPSVAPFGVAAPESKGQTVLYHVLRDRHPEYQPQAPPSVFVDGETLYTPGPDPDAPIFGDSKSDQLMWHESRGDSRRCHPVEGGMGPVSNVDRPCKVFPYPIFFTH